MVAVSLKNHCGAEAVTGGRLGVAVAAGFIWDGVTENHMALSRVLVALCVPIFMVAPRAQPIPAESWITQAALYLSGHDKPYTRAMWHAPRARLQ